MPRRAEIACLQTRPQPDFAAALNEALPLIESAAKDGAELILLPEYCGGLRSVGPAFAPPAEEQESHPFLLAMADQAARHGVWILVGSVAVPGAGSKSMNRGFLFDDQGEIQGQYDKIHLFDIDLDEGQTFRESATVMPGERAVLYDTPFGRIGHTICYDLRFPQLFRGLAQAGAEILTCPAAFTRTTGAAHWHVLNRARAIETGSFMLSPCAVGPIDGGAACYGHSLIINPWGEVLADGGEAAPAVIRATIDLDEVAVARHKIPSLVHDRPYFEPDMVA